jgi:hypothetical protein
MTGNLQGSRRKVLAGIVMSRGKSDPTNVYCTVHCTLCLRYGMIGTIFYCNQSISAHFTANLCQLSEMNLTKLSCLKIFKSVFFKYEQKVEFDEVFASSFFSINKRLDMLWVSVGFLSGFHIIMLFSDSDCTVLPSFPMMSVKDLFCYVPVIHENSS